MFNPSRAVIPSRRRIKSEVHLMINNGHFSLVSKSLRSGEKTDVELLVDDGRSIKAVKYFLRLHSPVFQAMFTGNWKEAGDCPTVDIKGIEFEVMRQLVNATHLGTATMWSVSFALKLLCAADRYQVKIAFDLVLDHVKLRLTESTVLKVLIEGNRLRFEELKEASFAYIRKNIHSLDITSLPGFDDLGKDTVKELFSLQFKLNSERIKLLQKEKDSIDLSCWALTTIGKYAARPTDFQLNNTN